MRAVDTENGAQHNGVMEKLPTMTPEDIRKRFEAIYGEPKLAEKLSVLTGTNRATVFRWFENGFPDMAVLILEFLEKTPEKLWPLRAHAPKNLR